MSTLLVLLALASDFNFSRNVEVNPFSGVIGATACFQPTGREQMCSPANEELVIKDSAGTHGICIATNTDGTLAIEDKTCSTAAIANASAFNAPTFDCSSAGAMAIGPSTCTSVVVTPNTTVSGTLTSTGAFTASAAANFSADVHTPVFANSVSSNTVTIARSNGDSQSLALTAATGTVTATLSGFAAGDTLTLTVTQKASSPVNVTWTGGGATVRWPGGTGPTISTGASAIDEIQFKCTAASTFNGTFSQNFQ